MHIVMEHTHIYPKSENLNDAIEICKQQKNNKSNDIPVVINEDGLVVYATEGIGKIVKIINGYATNSTEYTGICI